MRMPKIDLPLKFEHQEGIWVAYLPSEHGLIEVIVDGDESAPNQSQLEALGVFLCRCPELLSRLRKRLRPSFLFRPIRIAVNEASRVGVQYRNKLTRSQTKVFFADE